MSKTCFIQFLLKKRKKEKYIRKIFTDEIILLYSPISIIIWLFWNGSEISVLYSTRVSYAECQENRAMDLKTSRCWSVRVYEYSLIAILVLEFVE